MGFFFFGPLPRLLTIVSMRTFTGPECGARIQAPIRHPSGRLSDLSSPHRAVIASHSTLIVADLEATRRFCLAEALLAKSLLWAFCYSGAFRKFIAQREPAGARRELRQIQASEFSPTAAGGRRQPGEINFA
jgi:hypothetical protein